MPRGFQYDQCSAVITGASSGLGAEFARQLAPHARTLLLAARRAEALEEVRRELLGIAPALTVIVCPCDVSTDEGRARLIECIDTRDVRPNLLINNAGVGDYGLVSSADPARLQGQIDLNITALVLLAHAMIPRFQKSADAPAAILNVGSLAGALPMPDMAVYAATKSFVISFSEALRVELERDHIIVSCVCPGPTPTNFGKTARRPDGTDTDRGGQGLLRIPPQRVVRAGLDALRHSKACVFPGAGVSLAARLFRLMPRALMRTLLAARFRRSQR